MGIHASSRCRCPDEHPFLRRAILCPLLATFICLGMIGDVDSQDSGKAAKPPKKTGEEPPIDRLIRELYRVKTAAAAVRLIDESLVSNKWTEKEVQRLKVQRERFTELDRKQLVKLGTNWVTPSEREVSIERSKGELAQAKEDLK